MGGEPTKGTMNVPLLDLKAQYETIRADVDAAVRGVMETARFIGGPEVSGLEQEVARYSQCAHAVGCASGTDALLLALWALGIGPGDEVITTRVLVLRHRRGHREQRRHAGVRGHRPAHLQPRPAQARGRLHARAPRR